MAVKTQGDGAAFESFRHAGKPGAGSWRWLALALFVAWVALGLALGGAMLAGGSSPFDATGDAWYAVDRNSLILAQAAIAPAIWDQVLVPLLTVPLWLMLLVLTTPALMLGIALWGRRQPPPPKEPQKATRHASSPTPPTPPTQHWPRIWTSCPMSRPPRAAPVTASPICSPS